LNLKQSAVSNLEEISAHISIKERPKHD